MTNDMAKRRAMVKQITEKILPDCIDFARTAEKTSDSLLAYYVEQLNNYAAQMMFLLGVSICTQSMGFDYYDEVGVDIEELYDNILMLYVRIKKRCNPHR